jgi:predicted dithiol-disulfide oxidoreductase (DUF899 family)
MAVLLRHKEMKEAVEMNFPRVVSREEWLVARKELLAAEREAAEERMALSAERAELPMVMIDKKYVFDGPHGTAGLLDLFEGRRQLIVYHFMFDPAWSEGCKFCSLLADNIGQLSHLHARGTTMALVSRAPLAKIEPFKARMGWTVPWYSSYGSDFNYDFHVTLDEDIAPVEYDYRDRGELLAAGEPYFTAGEQGGLSVFLRDGDTVYHTYSTYADGTDLLHGTLMYLDLTPLGRQDDSALRHHDRYGG